MWGHWTTVIGRKSSSIFQWGWRIHFTLRISPGKLLGAPFVVIWTALKYVLSVFRLNGRRCVFDTCVSCCCKLRPNLGGFYHHWRIQSFYVISTIIQFLFFFLTTVFFNGTEGLVCFADKRSQSGSLGCQSTPAPLKLFLKSRSWELRRGSWQLNSPRRCVIGTRTQELTVNALCVWPWGDFRDRKSVV